MAKALQKRSFIARRIRVHSLQKMRKERRSNPRRIGPGQEELEKDRERISGDFLFYD